MSLRGILLHRPFVSVSLRRLQGVYNHGSFLPQYFYLYDAIIINCAQIWALYILALFCASQAFLHLLSSRRSAAHLFLVPADVNLKKDLSPLSPIWKFGMIKAIVFVTWWQSIIISGAASLGLLHYTDLEYSAEQIPTNLQDFLICIEMFLAAGNRALRPLLEYPSRGPLTLSRFFSLQWAITTRTPCPTFGLPTAGQQVGMPLQRRLVILAVLRQTLIRPPVSRSADAYAAA